MKVIPLAQACNLISQASACIIEVHEEFYTLQPEVNFKGEVGNVCVQFVFEADGGQCALSFYESNNQEVEVSGGSIFLKSRRDITYQIQLLSLWEIESQLQPCGHFINAIRSSTKTGIGTNYCVECAKAAGDLIK